MTQKKSTFDMMDSEDPFEGAEYEYDESNPKKIKRLIKKLITLKSQQ